ncbi:MAG: hypothetical protein PHE17_19690 [Thiothrix sp.]|uniref:hypothetical protein n=1 Tax=Thiothrix sp. TaxID=1032 RepID=UPI002603EFD5|nr:hypothetical protein [Thiothrix sp.]MDD5395251.1 hypothetical protein [Thiothrix sp.]
MSGEHSKEQELRQEVDTLQARLKQEKHWRVNATKVAERRKVQVDRLKQECAELSASLTAVGTRVNYLHGEILKANPSFKLPEHLLQ